ncbi:hypothetical protein BKA93DRAFT_818870 [Sparassis latifolia]
MASTSTHHLYPFPTHAHPTPHQIFHLPPGASQKDIKARYYDLVRVHHPDSPMCRNLSAEVRHVRFRSITAAYDALRGKGKHGANAHDAVRAELERRRRAQRRSRERAEFAGAAAFSDSPWHAEADDRWKDWLIITAAVMSLAAGLGPALLWPAAGMSDRRHQAASQNLAEARRVAKVHGTEQRQEIRRRVEESKRSQSGEDGSQPQLDNS